MDDGNDLRLNFLSRSASIGLISSRYNVLVSSSCTFKVTLNYDLHLKIAFRTRFVALWINPIDLSPSVYLVFFLVLPLFPNPHTVAPSRRPSIANGNGKWRASTRVQVKIRGNDTYIIIYSCCSLHTVLLSYLIINYYPLGSVRIRIQV